MRRSTYARTHLPQLEAAAARLLADAEWVTWEAPGIKCDGCAAWTPVALLVPVPHEHAHRVCPACSGDAAVLRRLWDRRINRLSPAGGVG